MGFERGRETWPVRRELPSGGVADGYQSIPIQSVSSAPSHGNSFLLLSHPPRRLVHLARTTCCRESTSRASILGLSNDNFKGRRERRGYERVKRRASCGPDRESLSSSLHLGCKPRATLLGLSWEYPPVRRLCLLGECLHYFDDLPLRRIEFGSRRRFVYMLKEGMWNTRSLNRRAYITPWIYKLAQRQTTRISKLLFHLHNILYCGHVTLTTT